EVFGDDEVAERDMRRHELFRRGTGKRPDVRADVDDGPGRVDLAAEHYAGDVLDQRAKLVATLREPVGGGLHAAAVAGVDVEEGEEHQARRRAAEQDQPGFGAVVVSVEGRRAAEARQPGAAGNLHRVVDDEA